MAIPFKQSVVVEEVYQGLAVLNVLGLQIDDTHQFVSRILVVCNCAEVSDHIKRQLYSGTRNSDALQFQHFLHDLQLLVRYVRLLLRNLKVQQVIPLIDALQLAVHWTREVLRDYLLVLIQQILLVGQVRPQAYQQLFFSKMLIEVADFYS